MKAVMHVVLAVACTVTLCAQQSQRPQLPPCKLQNLQVQVQLMSPLSTASAKPGDAFTTNVVAPPQLKDAKIEGDVKSLVQAQRGFGKGKPHIEMEFTTLTTANQTCAITGDLQDVKNSKGVANVDDEGRVIGHTSNKKRVGTTLGFAALGALAGYAATGSGTGALGGSAVGAAVGFVLSSTLTTAGTDIDFQPNSVFTLKVSGARPNR